MIPKSRLKKLIYVEFCSQLILRFSAIVVQIVMGSFSTPFFQVWMSLEVMNSSIPSVP